MQSSKHDNSKIKFAAIFLIFGLLTVTGLPAEDSPLKDKKMAFLLSPFSLKTSKGKEATRPPWLRQT